jgi:hypothetical protein
MLRAVQPTHVFLDVGDLVPGRTLRPTAVTRGEVHVIVDGLVRLDTGTLAGLLQVYAALLARGASGVRFLVGAEAARELARLGLATLLAPSPSPSPSPSPVRLAA